MTSRHSYSCPSVLDQFSCYWWDTKTVMLKRDFPLDDAVLAYRSRSLSQEIPGNNIDFFGEKFVRALVRPVVLMCSVFYVRSKFRNRTPKHKKNRYRKPNAQTDGQVDKQARIFTYIKCMYGSQAADLDVTNYCLMQP